ncbi:MAG: DUF493 domain-containing protein [Sulfurimonas sp.]|nr:DUF493 domain-containing protein [Sulfurimonadaceae bacterium]
MEILNETKQKLELEYPCLWSYKLIGVCKEDIECAIKEVILEKEHTLKHSNNSKSGKYISMNFELLVHNDDERTYIFDSLKKHDKIKFVL